MFGRPFSRGQEQEGCCAGLQLPLILCNGWGAGDDIKELSEVTEFRVRPWGTISPSFLLNPLDTTRAMSSMHMLW
ncbi:hypothetical protein EYF80_005048 [Liparis tanakae]|uniref:Uncharacterized protein n=1 Tax=Liparis tanakae TaxID=230148 RepID=A0A4Z2J552_9TELE|nr:hypothetical protein EYF80_005048 [Liparis tanakae]